MSHKGRKLSYLFITFSCVCVIFSSSCILHLFIFSKLEICPNIETGNQAGFRKNYSTKDHLVRLESFIRDAFIKKEHCVAIFFDLEKAYDTTWKYWHHEDLHDIGLRGRLPNFISNFLSDRSFNVRIGSTLSDTFEQEQGVSQGVCPVPPGGGGGVEIGGCFALVAGG